MNMDSFTGWMEEHFVPVASKIGSQKFLVAIRDGFIGILPITMAGSIATLLNVFFNTIPSSFGWTGFVNAMAPIIAIDGNVWWGSLAILSLVFAFSLGYQIARAYNVNPLSGGLISFASLIVVTPQSVNITTEAGEILSAGGIPSSYMGATGLFTAMIIGFISTIIFSKLMVKNIIIKLPESVPPAVSKAFASIIPGITAMYVCAILAYIVSALTGGSSIGDLIQQYIQIPFLGLSQGIFSVIIITFFVSLLWFFGLHGPNVLAPILDGVYLPALIENTNFFNTHQTTVGMPYLWTRGSFDAYSWMGGTGCTLGLIIAIFIFSKREETKTIAKLAAPMGIFNINEPLIFGLPIVLNPLYIIPWVCVPTLMVAIAYIVTSMGLVPPVFMQVPWVTPPIIMALLATGGNIGAAILAAFNLALSVILWAPFVIVGNKVEVKEEEE